MVFPSVPGFLSRRAVIGACAVALSTRMAGADALHDGRFRDEVVAVLRVLYPGAPITLGGDTREVTVGTSTLYLGNLYAMVDGLAGEPRRRRLATYLTEAMPSGPSPAGGSSDASPTFEPFTTAQRRLRIQIIPGDYLKQEASIVHAPLSQRLLIAYALDEANRYQVVTEPMFASWGVDRTVLDRIARRNSEAEAVRVPIEVSPTGERGRFASSATEDGYSAARLLLPGFMDRMRERLGTAAIVAAVPTREIVIGWTPDSVSRRPLASAVRKLFRNGPYARSDELFRYDDAGLRPLDVRERAEYEP